MSGKKESTDCVVCENTNTEEVESRSVRSGNNSVSIRVCKSTINCKMRATAKGRETW